MAGGGWNCGRCVRYNRHCKPRERPQGHGGRPGHRVSGIVAMRAPSIAVRCSGVTKSFPAGGGLVEVLHGINFEAPAGELTMLVGSENAGIPLVAAGVPLRAAARKAAAILE